MRDEVASVIPHKLEEKADECPVESIGIEKDKLLEQLRQFFESQPLAVLATQNGIAPYVNLVAFASNEQSLRIFFFQLRKLPESTQTCWQILQSPC